MELIPERLKSRKLWVFLGVAVAAFVLLLEGMITNEQWVDVTKWAAVGYVGGQGIADGLSRLRS